MRAANRPVTTIRGGGHSDYLFALLFRNYSSKALQTFGTIPRLRFSSCHKHTADLFVSQQNIANKNRSKCALKNELPLSDQGPIEF
jgi:hypothetical protein